MSLPRAYADGEVEFYGCKISVTSDVLIPRQESEILVDLLLGRIERGVLLDLCTGSGCIGISIKKYRPNLDVILSDVSEKALNVARENATQNDVNVKVVQGDLLTPFLGEKVNYIVCNPPYVSEKEYADLEASVRDHEPKLALVGGEDGLLFYHRLEKEMREVLKAGGKVFFEIGSLQGERVKEIYSNSHWCKLEILKDWSGHDRFFFLEKAR